MMIMTMIMIMVLRSAVSNTEMIMMMMTMIMIMRSAVSNTVMMMMMKIIMRNVSPRVFPVSVMFITASTALSRATVSLRAVVAWPLW